MKKQPMAKVVVPVSFTGTVEVEVPAAVPEERRESLARKVALARLLATTDSPDAPEDDAGEEDQVEFGLDDATAERNWDACKTTGVSGKWSLQETTARRTILPWSKGSWTRQMPVACSRKIWTRPSMSWHRASPPT